MEVIDQNSNNEINLQSCLLYLQKEHRRYEMDRNEWEIEKATLKNRVAFLEGEKLAAENIKQDLLRRIKMLEYSLIKLKEDNDDKSPIHNQTAKDIKKKNRESGNSILSVESSNLLNFSKGFGHMRSTELLKSYLKQVGYLMLNEQNDQPLLDPNENILPKVLLQKKNSNLNTTNKETETVPGSVQNINNIPENNQISDELRNLSITSKDKEQDSDLNNDKLLWKPVATLKSHFDSIRHFEFSSTENTLITASEDHTAKLFNLSNVKKHYQATNEIDPVFTFRGHTGPLTSMQYTRNELYTSSVDSTIRCWKVPDKNQDKYESFDSGLTRTLVGHTDIVWSIKLNKNQNLLASSSADSTVKIWDINSYTLKQTLKNTDCNENLSTFRPTVVDFFDNENKIFIGTREGTISLIDIEYGKVLLKFENVNSVNEKNDTYFENQVNCLDFKNGLLISGTENHKLNVFDINSGNLITEVLAHSNSISTINFSFLEENVVASGDHDCSIRWWDIKNLSSINCLQEITTHRKKNDSGVFCCRYSKFNNGLFGSAGADGLVKLYLKK
ncbi:hypothetical protein HK099_001985 [Clydaea vesicula]|uniref:Striatin N-terminal domain-containing protein n=1 Tax=Clydaea vesicula TaxID=447962 RepID=A0AAD5XWX2_9FUNG|nr:hypothetical protein HK099_001985 [Clydaea vesicula]KAJ3388890.1 hypothetical protein HDU92_001309 [Lobulomyces angularis]